MDRLTLWRRYKEYLCECRPLGMSIDISRIDFPDDFFRQMQPQLDRAFEAMANLEGGEIANPDEQRMVGHYWLRAAFMAPNDEITEAIEQTDRDVKAFAADIHEKRVAPPQAQKYTEQIVVGIGGSALGPQLVADALGQANGKRDKLMVHFVDNTDPDGIDRLVASLGARIKSTLVVVISKSGGTKETRNGMLELETAFARKGLDLAQQAVAVTGEGSQLDHYATEKGWIRRFPMWDWVGGRTSVMSAVGLLPAALQGLDVQSFLDGAAEMDEQNRKTEVKANPAALLALGWYHATDGAGRKDMVILPYKDRLLLMSRYLQQLVMESLGKELDLDGNPVHQGIAVYGNKGSTDQHAYVQQLRDGVANFFATFIVVLQDRNPLTAKTAPWVDPGVTSGDYLNGFWQGTRSALFEKGRGSITITIEKLDAHSLGALIALYERAVGIYATLINVNAYHQPGVEAGKKAATHVLEVQNQVVAYLEENPDPASPEQLADRMGIPHEAETIHHVLTHLAANKRGIKRSGKKFRPIVKKPVEQPVG